MSNNRKNHDEDKNQIEIPSFMNYQEEDDDDEFMDELNSSLAQQIDSEFYDEEDGRPRKKRMSILIKIPLALLAILLVLGCLVAFTKPGRKLAIGIAGRYIYSHLEFGLSEENQTVGKDDSSGSNSKSDRPKTANKGPVINILLIGIEEIKGNKNTDSMIIATMNTKDHTLKLTSLMRDLYVEIPGYKNGRLNSAYAKGGIDLLYDTIETNFDVTIDGYCMVNFEAFEQIVDIVGGVNIKLTEKEAKYLNSTNYISEKINRNVVAGDNLMNGNQALGYCRVRKVSTATEGSDFGRTQRQRIVLQAIYDKVKSKNLFQLFKTAEEILKNVKIKTDVSRNDFISYLEAAASLKIKELETHRIPSDGNYLNESVKIGSRNAAVLVPKDWEETKKEIKDFIYGAAVTNDKKEE